MKAKLVLLYEGNEKMRLLSILGLIEHYGKVDGELIGENIQNFRNQKDMDFDIEPNNLYMIVHYLDLNKILYYFK
ncbi:hypothetical protein QNI19_10395 [Cytophagaceae bacterium DM2B3-1]|uniref:Uncharacterized protein n=1 Tax=Xanthocytophaga flava TaxID=3048013 RepID=A0ABT7CHY0_9BACT|nr:hypothetical protein [Xanthocytophaga flavus]MDJ1493339.1 hypothetical protein [Xanthocytophaga flavus]